jgi:hypothetical protein
VDLLRQPRGRGALLDTSCAQHEAYLQFVVELVVKSGNWTLPVYLWSIPRRGSVFHWHPAAPHHQRLHARRACDISPHLGFAILLLYYLFGGPVF